MPCKYWFFLALFCHSTLAQSQHVMMDEVSIDEPKERTYRHQGAAPITVRLIHTDLKASPNFENKTLGGNAVVTVSAVGADVDTLVFDAKKMKFHEVKVAWGKREEKVRYFQDRDSLKIFLPLSTPLKKSDTLNVFFKYTARPELMEGKGGKAVTGSKGLYFIEPNGHSKKTIPQFWTQGEPEFTSVWLPTIDKPNQRMTHAIALTVDSTYLTLSNGKLHLQTQNGDGTRTDFWRQDLPHAPYLAMIAGGPFVRIKANHARVPIAYIVEPGHEETSKKVFEKTPEMIDFFESRFGVKYPWAKYDQIIVREFVSGGMENTTATVMGDFLYEDEYTISEADHEDIIAHELAHQWFGNLVTTRSWAHITTNEGFASYAEYLWHEHDKGREVADLRFDIARLYVNFESKFGNDGPIVRYEYDNPDELFDINTYQKGARVLHLLRKELGDSVFFLSLKTYLETFQYATVEIESFRWVVETITKKDYHWFFDQWYYKRGLPVIEVEKNLSEDQKSVSLTLRQAQFDRWPHLYKIPLDVAIYTKKNKTLHTLNLQDEYTRITLKADEKILAVELDADYAFLGFVMDSLTIPQNKILLERAPITGRLKSLEDLMEQIEVPEERVSVLEMALNDPYFVLQYEALEYLAKEPESVQKKLKKPVVKIAKQGQYASMRAKAIKLMAEVYNENDPKLYESAAAEKSYPLATEAIVALAKWQPEKAYKLARDFYKVETNPHRQKLLGVIAAKGDTADFNLIIENADSKDPAVQKQLFLALAHFAGKGEIGGSREVALNKLREKFDLSQGEEKQRAAEALEQAIGFWEHRLKHDFLSGKERETLRNDIKEWKEKLKNR